MTEIWLPVRCNKNYLVSNIGNIKTAKTGKVRKNRLLADGYISVKLFNNKRKHHFIHRLVLSAFKPIDNETGYVAHHKNHIRSDNRIENLEWVDHVDNTRMKFVLPKKTLDVIKQLESRYGEQELYNLLKGLL